MSNMKNNNKRAFAALLVLILIVGALVWFFNRKGNSVNQQATPVLSISSYNQTQNKDATLATARPNDIVVFLLTAENKTAQLIPGYSMEANISEVADKSVLIDAQGASYNSATNSLVWTPLDIPANASIQKQFSVRINQLGVNASSDVLRIKFNNQIQVALAHPVVAGISQTPPLTPLKAPVTGPEGDLSLWLALGTASGYFLARKYRSRKA